MIVLKTTKLCQKLRTHESFRHGSRHGSSLVTKFPLSVFVAVWMRESGLGPPTHVRANSKPAASRAPPKALTSQARIGQVLLVTLHTGTSLTRWNPSPAGFASQTRTCMGTFKGSKEQYGILCDWTGPHFPSEHNKQRHWIVKYNRKYSNLRKSYMFMAIDFLSIFIPYTAPRVQNWQLVLEFTFVACFGPLRFRTGYTYIVQCVVFWLTVCF
jgi:hypothetical protein